MNGWYTAPCVPSLSEGQEFKIYFFPLAGKNGTFYSHMWPETCASFGNTQAVPAVFTQVLAEDSHTVFPLWVPVWMLLFSWALVQLPQGEAFGHFSQRKQTFVVRIVKFHLQSTGVNFHTFTTVRGNAQCLYGNMIISNSKIPSFQEGSELESEPFTFITKYCCGVSLVWEVSLFLAYCISDLKNQKKKSYSNRNLKALEAFRI